MEKEKLTGNESEKGRKSVREHQTGKKSGEVTALEEPKTAATLSEEERQKLCEKLDQDLNDFVASLPKQEYTDGWPEDSWEEEMEKHPFFMSEPPKEGEPLPPLLAGLQQLKYDPDNNTTEELASSYKDDGNYNFKLKKYRFAVANYTEGLKQRCANIQLNAVLFSNRAAAHFHLENYRSAIRDCRSCLQLQPEHLKAWVCGTRSCMKLELYEEAASWCQKGHQIDPSNDILLNLEKEAKNLKKEQERNKRREAKKDMKRLAVETALLDAIKKRGISIKGCKAGKLTLEHLEPQHPGLSQHRVHLEPSDGLLVWPVVFMYPEHQQSDLVEAFHEDQCFLDHLQVMFGEASEEDQAEPNPPWDSERKYRVQNLRLYYETSEGGIQKVAQTQTLRSVLTSHNYCVTNGTPSFIVLVEDSRAQQEFLQCYSLTPS